LFNNKPLGNTLGDDLSKTEVDTEAETYHKRAHATLLPLLKIVVPTIKYGETYSIDAPP
jgi:hypothetical protein